MSEPYDADSCTCPQCEGEAVMLGVLGSMIAWRCRACGWTFETHVEPPVTTHAAHVEARIAKRRARRRFK
jgi:rubredoxin